MTAAILSLMTALSLSACGDEEYDTGYDAETEYSSEAQESSDYALSNTDFPLGSADFPDGNTVVVSIIANDTNSGWDEESEDDEARLSDSLNYLGMACDYIEEQSRRWGYDAKFIYDRDTNEDLAYDADFSLDLTSDAADSDYAIDDYIVSEIPSAELMKKYDADNIIYMLFLNTPEDNQETSFTTSWFDGTEYPYEVCRMLVNCDGEEEAPAAYAHEILHTFGAPDLYSVPEPEYGITDEFFDYIKENDNNDLMYTVYNAQSDEAEYDGISNEITELDAYYIGWTDKCDIVSEWGLGASQHR